jgi:hypothetical protein
VLIVVGCPACGVPAEVTDCFTLASTDGPIEHLAVRCAAGHHFRMPSDLLPPQAQRQLRAQQCQLTRAGLPLTAAVVPAKPEGD